LHPAEHFYPSGNGLEIRSEALRNDYWWNDATTLLFEVGARLFVEMRPGHVLTRLAEDAFPEARLRL